MNIHAYIHMYTYMCIHRNINVLKGILLVGTLFVNKSSLRLVRFVYLHELLWNVLRLLANDIIQQSSSLLQSSPRPRGAL